MGLIMHMETTCVLRRKGSTSPSGRVFPFPGVEARGLRKLLSRL